MAGLELDPQASDEIEALELARWAAATDVGAETLRRLEQAVDDLAAYPRTPPAELLERIRAHLAYVARLLDARNTLTEHRRLLVAGGWLSLLGATCHVDLHQRPAAAARLRTAASLAGDAEHAEIAGWCLETQAWQALTDGDYRQAVTLSRARRPSHRERARPTCRRPRRRAVRRPGRWRERPLGVPWRGCCRRSPRPLRGRPVRYGRSTSRAVVVVPGVARAR